MLLDVVKVSAGADYSLTLELENGEVRHFDMAPYIDRRPWVRVKPLPLFRQAAVGLGTVVWPGEIDIDPETLYELSAPVTPCPS